jgi:general L-amino acid transport system permease protein
MLATLIGVVVGVLRTSTNPVMSFLGTCYVEAIRNVPLILQAFFWYAVYTHLPSPRQAIDLGGVLLLSSRGLFVPGLSVSEGAGLFAGAAILAAIVLALTFALMPRPSLQQRISYPKLSRLSLLGGLVVALVILFFGRDPELGLFQLPELKGLNFTGGIGIPPEFAALLTAMSLYGGAFLG